jgi:hypothetical protein
MTLADIGREIYEKPYDEGGCADFHEIRRDSHDRSTPAPDARRSRTLARMRANSSILRVTGRSKRARGQACFLFLLTPPGASQIF